MAPPPRPRIEDVARAAGVARSTAALALRDSPRLRPETREAVREAARRLRYVYDRAAARLRSGRSGLVGLLVCEITNPFYAELTAGVNAALDEAGLVAVMADTAESPARQARVLARLREQRVDGLIVMPASGTPHGLAAELDGWGLPWASAVRELGPGAHAGPDNAAGARLATEHLLRLGHRRVAFLGGAAANTASAGRLAGYEAAMRAAGLAPETLPCRSDLGEASAIAAGLPRRGGPTGLVCFNDGVAFGACLGLLRSGRLAGREVAVTGFDDVREAASWFPPLTTARVSPAGIGAAAARLLLARMADPAAPPGRAVLAPTLVVRQSCGAPR